MKSATLKLWTPYHDPLSSDDEENSPWAVKAKESPLPSISSSDIWEKSPTPGLHHRMNINPSRQYGKSAFTSYANSSPSSSPVRVLPRTVHSPYRPPRRPRTMVGHARNLVHQPWKFELFTFLGALLTICWILTGLLYAYLPSWRVQYTPTLSWIPDNPSFLPHQSFFVKEESPLNGLKRSGTFNSPSSSTRRRRDSRKARVRSIPNNDGVNWQPSAPKFDLSEHHDNIEKVEENNVVQTASMEALCGYAAEMASLEHPQFFPAQLALDSASSLVWIGPRWDILENLLQSCPSTQLLQIAHTLPDDPYERLQWLREYPSLISAPDHHIRFVETLPMGLQTRETTKLVNFNTTTHVIWAFESSKSLSLITQLVQTRQMLLDLETASVSHLTILADDTIDQSQAWRETFARLAAARSGFWSVQITWISDLDALVPALQMRNPLHPVWWKVDESVRRNLLPEASALSRPPVTLSLPCASECADPNSCEPSVWDETVNLTRTITQDCDVVVYSVNGGSEVRDLPASEYRVDETEDSTVICNLAFVAQSSTLVQSVIQRVPNQDLVRLGVHPQPGDDPHAIHSRKLDALNGKLLYRGWILVWVNSTWSSNSLLSLSPGKFWSADVHYSLYCDHTVAPTYDDSKFLVNQMRRSAWPARNAKYKSARYKLPAEPAREAVLLVAERTTKDKKKITFLRKAMSHWDPYDTNSTFLQRQAALYDQYDVWLNRQRHQRRYYKPQPLDYRYELAHWAETRWILHNHHQLPTASDFRCEWYMEVVQTSGSSALALTHILGIIEMTRRMEFGEPNDHMIQHTWARRMVFKEAVTDTHEWIALAADANRPYAHLAYQLESAHSTVPTVYKPTSLSDQTPVYVRIVSDRVMAAARKAYRG